MHSRIPVKQASEATNPRGAKTSGADGQLNLENTLRELTGRLINVQDQERRRIARDLHDSVGQMVALLKMNLDRIARSTPEPSELIAESVALVDSLSTQLRTISYLLHPPLLDEIGLLPALRGLAEGFSERSGIETTLQIDDRFGRLAGELEISIYRIVQECLTNVHRHSGSPVAEILVERNAIEVLVEVRDKGLGMPNEKGRGMNGVGLNGMRERARQLGGTLEVKSNGKGTIVIVRLPLSKETALTMAANKPRLLHRNNRTDDTKTIESRPKIAGSYAPGRRRG